MQGPPAWPRAGSASPSTCSSCYMSFKGSNWATMASASRTSAAFPHRGKQEHQGNGEAGSLASPPRPGSVLHSSTATFPFPRDLGAGLAVPQDPKQPGLSGSPLVSMARRRPTAPWCPCSPCRSPSLEKGFYYTSESVSSGLKLDPDGLGCIWALFFVGPKVAGLRNACCHK